MSQSKLSPGDVLTALQKNATRRTHRSLGIIHAICRDQHACGNRDFSVATIGHLSSSRGGPSSQAIRNTTGAHYRALLHAWAKHCDGIANKAPVRPEPGVAEDVLGMISDPSVRAVVGCFLAENRKLKAENTLLKMHAQVVIDCRPCNASSRLPSSPRNDVTSLVSTLMPLEIEALRHAISEEQLRKMRWSIDPKTGRVSHRGHGIFRAGFATAIKKLLDSSRSE